MANGTTVAIIVGVVIIAAAGGGIAAFTLSNSDDDDSGSSDVTEYTITFDAATNGGKLSGDPTMKAQPDKGVTITAEATKEGHTFTGWYTSASGGEKVPTDGTLRVSGDVTYYAQFDINKYNVTAPVSTVAYQTDAADKEVTYKDSYTFTVTLPDKYRGNVTATADGTHGDISRSVQDRTTTFTIADIRSDITNISLSGAQELGIGTHFDYVLSGTWSYETQNGTLSGSDSFEYVAQNAEEMFFTRINITNMINGNETISTADNTDEPGFLYGNLDYADFCLNLSSTSEDGTADVITIDGAKTLKKFGITSGDGDYAYYVDTPTNIIYRMTGDVTVNGVTLHEVYDLSEYEILYEDPYTESEELTQKYTMSVTGTYISKAISGTMEVLYWAEAPTQYITKTVYDIHYTDDSSDWVVGETYDLEDIEDDEPLIPTGAIRGEDVVMMTVDGEMTLQTWTYTEDDTTYTVYKGTHDGKDVPYKMTEISSSHNITYLLTEYVIID